MNLKYIRQRVRDIKEMAADNEIAHGAEDTLHQDVLRAIADGKCENPRACAKAALGTLKLDFSRWYA